MKPLYDLCGPLQDWVLWFACVKCGYRTCMNSGRVAVYCPKCIPYEPWPNRRPPHTMMEASDA